MLLIVATVLTGVIGEGLIKTIEKFAFHGAKNAQVEQLFGRLDLIAPALAAVGVFILIAGIYEKRHPFEGGANALRPVSPLIRLDLPTLERPANAISGAAIGGSEAIELAAERKSHSPANSSRPASTSALEKSPVLLMSRNRRRRPPGTRSSLPGLSSAQPCVNCRQTRHKRRDKVPRRRVSWTIGRT
jgi:hypothetical protein